VACINNTGARAWARWARPGNFQGLSDFQTWVCTGLPCCWGGWNCLSVLVLLTPQFWRR
jgi:trk system potassium uptake protein TrkH